MNIQMTDKELNALVSLLDDGDQEIKEHVRDKILSLGNQIIPFLENKWEGSFNPELQKEIEEIVHDMQLNLLKERLSNWKDSQERELLEGLWIVNTYLYPDLEFDQLNALMQQIYFDVWTNFKNELSVYDKIKLINNVMFNDLKFSANTKNFHSPANSMLKTVLETKKGNPISLCSVYLLVAKKLGLPVYGVNLPNLFVLTYQSGKFNFYINAFNKGLIFTKQDINNYLDHLKLDPKPEYYEPCENIEIIRRVIRNLIFSFEKIGDLDKSKEVNQLLKIVNQP
ncbi:transglutaminase-like domain-containing protein [Cyclobacterium sp. 1_MG-2023]|uniref:transglutaminase-like domain-containing protein n=1 Tax=Cyclobacterium sp. 1_MG-2023 TaxID=3062681 RepID=UPI0026E2485B|nr:transglutaminase-like domain-containing protein [Cyclobacterium sp. 1_MG-2023]|eukprot:TRINITY_DN21629_c0_g1_i1.p1 TRINITY_DN21629_c0_g1~~TRINITY_DN21629_c0_g1_i1.p1  ORF type:complete len:283 (+),score=8.78 TRINITY_DN21629_c0_g1_i1:313-1161(+)